MKKLKILLILSVLVSLSAHAQYFLSGQAGYFQLVQTAASEMNVTPTGMSYAGGFGKRKDFFEFEALLMKANAEDDINHDGQDNTLVHEQTSLILAMNFYLTKAFYLRAGLGVHKIDQKLGDDVNAASELGAKEAYGIIEDEVTEGIVLGAGFVLFNGKNTDIYTQIERYNYSSVDSGAWNATLGFRFYLQ